MDTEDCLVHGIKPGKVAVDAAAAILAETAKLIAGNDDYNVSYPLAFDEDLDDDETVMNDN